MQAFHNIHIDFLLSRDILWLKKPLTLIHRSVATSATSATLAQLPYKELGQISRAKKWSATKK